MSTNGPSLHFFCILPLLKENMNLSGTLENVLQAFFMFPFVGWYFLSDLMWWCDWLFDSNYMFLNISDLTRILLTTFQRNLMTYFLGVSSIRLKDSISEQNLEKKKTAADSQTWRFPELLSFLWLIDWSMNWLIDWLIDWLFKGNSDIFRIYIYLCTFCFCFSRIVYNFCTSATKEGQGCQLKYGAGLGTASGNFEPSTSSLLADGQPGKLSDKIAEFVHNHLINLHQKVGKSFFDGFFCLSSAQFFRFFPFVYSPSVFPFCFSLLFFPSVFPFCFSLLFFSSVFPL